MVRGRPLVTGGGGSKNKNRAGETKRKKICAPKMFEKKFCGRDYIQTNYQHKQKILKKKFVQVEKVRPKGHVTRIFLATCNAILYS